VDFPVPTSFTPEVVRHALAAFELIFRPGFKYKKAGVILLELVPEGEAQGELFDTVNRDRAQRLMTALDGINGRHGRQILGFAAGRMRKGWKPKFEKRTENFTTSWDGLPDVSA
jgi:DNA polymerase V